MSYGDYISYTDDAGLLQRAIADPTQTIFVPNKYHLASGNMGTLAGQNRIFTIKYDGDTLSELSGSDFGITVKNGDVLSLENLNMSFRKYSLVNNGTTNTKHVSITNQVTNNGTMNTNGTSFLGGYEFINNGTLNVFNGSFHTKVINDGTITFTDNVETGALNGLYEDVTGSGTINVDIEGSMRIGDNLIKQNYLNINSGEVYIKSDKLQIVNGVNNCGNLYLGGGTLKSKIKGIGTTIIEYDTQAEESIVNDIIVNSSAALTVSATNVKGNVTIQSADTYAGKIILSSGNLTHSITGGSIKLIGDVVADADLLKGDIKNAESTLTLTGDNKTLTHSILSDFYGKNGQLIIAGNITANEYIENHITINEGAQLKIDANNVGAPYGGVLKNGGVLVLTGGTDITNPVDLGRSIVELNGNKNSITIIDGHINGGVSTALQINPGRSFSGSASGNVSNGGTFISNGSSIPTINNYGSNVGTTIINYSETEATGHISNYLTINSDKQLTANADFIGNNTIINDTGRLVLNSGKLNARIQGNTIIQGDVLFAENASMDKVNVLGSLDIGDKTVELKDAEINGTLKLTITDIEASNTTYAGGHLQTDKLTIGADATLSLTIESGLLAENSSTGELKLITANTYEGSNSEFTNMLSNNRYTITPAGNGKYNISYVKSVEDVVDGANGTGNEAAVGAAWDSIGAGSLNGHAEQIREMLNELSQHDDSQYVRVLQKITPPDNTKNTILALTVDKMLDNMISARQKAQGRNAGDGTDTALGVWVNGLYNYINKKSGTTFTGNSINVAFGADSMLANDFTAGIGYGFTKQSISLEATDTQADGHSLFLYAKYQPSKWYLRSNLNYSFVEYDESNSIREANYNLNAFGGQFASGYNMDNGLTPEIGLRYIKLMQEEYVDSINQKADAIDNDIMSLFADLMYVRNFNTINNINVAPEIHVGVGYDIITPTSDTFVTIGNDVAAYKVIGDELAPFSITAGIGLNITSGFWSFEISYNLDTRKDYNSHTGMLKARYNF